MCGILCPSNTATMRQKSRKQKDEARRCNQEEERPLRQMSGAKQIPDVEPYQASQGEDPSQLLTIPSHDQTHANPNRPEGQTDPLLKHWSWAAASRALADGEREDDKYAENAPHTSDPARYGCDRASCHNLLPMAGTILLGRLASGSFACLLSRYYPMLTPAPPPLPYWN